MGNVKTLIFDENFTKCLVVKRMFMFWKGLAYKSDV